MLGFSHDVHETLLALTLHVYFNIFSIFGYFFSFYNSTAPRIVEFLSFPVICYLMEILLAVREWERKRMGITNGNGKRMGIKVC